MYRPASVTIARATSLPTCLLRKTTMRRSLSLIARKVHALRVPAHKVLVLDCDETLWHGVVGEEASDGVTISPRACPHSAVRGQYTGAGRSRMPGEQEYRARRLEGVREKVGHDAQARTDCQRTALTGNRSRVSRLNGHEPESRAGFVRLSWTTMVECALMRAELPEVVTLQVPLDEQKSSCSSPVSGPSIRWLVTDEDARRTSMYREDAARQRPQGINNRYSRVHFIARR